MRIVLLFMVLGTALVVGPGCEKKRKEVVEEVGGNPKRVLDEVEAKTDAMMKKRAQDADDALQKAMGAADEAAGEKEDKGGGW